MTVWCGGSVTMATCLLRTPTRGRKPSSRAAERTRLRVSEGISELLLNTRLTVPGETWARVATLASTPETALGFFVLCSGIFSIRLVLSGFVFPILIILDSHAKVNSGMMEIPVFMQILHKQGNYCIRHFMWRRSGG
jgi:hypothetical protein